MFNQINLLSLADLKLKYSAAAQHISAQNIANADTPGYRAVNVKSFDTILSEFGAHSHAMRPMDDLIVDRRTPQAHYIEPNKNNVSLDEAMVAATRHKSSHDQAVAITKSTFDILRLSLGR